MIFADAEIAHGWDRFIDLLPILAVNVVTAIFAGVAMLYGAKNHSKNNEIANASKKIEQKVDYGNVLTAQGTEHIVKIESATKDAKDTAVAAAVIAKKAEATTADVATANKERQEAVLDTLKTIVTQTNGISDKRALAEAEAAYHKGRAEVAEDHGDRLNKLEQGHEDIKSSLSEVLKIVKQISST